MKDQNANLTYPQNDKKLHIFGRSTSRFSISCCGGRGPCHATHPSALHFIFITPQSSLHSSVCAPFHSTHPSSIIHPFYSTHPSALHFIFITPQSSLHRAHPTQTMHHVWKLGASPPHSSNWIDGRLKSWISSK